MEFVGGPLDGERHDIGELVGLVTRMVEVGESDGGGLHKWEAVTYERRQSPSTGRTRMIFAGFQR